MSKASKSTSVATLDPTPAAMTVVVPQDAMELFTQDMGLAPQFAPDEKAMPFLRIAQSMTPQAKKMDPSYIDGLAEGDFFTVLTRRVFAGEEGLTFLPAYFTKNYMQWRPRALGGGIVKDYGTDRAASGLDNAVRNADTNKLMVGENEIVESMVYFGFIVDTETGEYEEAVLSLSSTQLPKARRWNTLIGAQRAPGTTNPVPIFGRAYHLTTSNQTKDKYNWAVINAAPVEWIFDLPNWQSLYHAAKVVNTAFTKGDRKIVADAEIIDFPAAPQETMDARSYASQPAANDGNHAPDYEVEDDLS